MSEVDEIIVDMDESLPTNETLDSNLTDLINTKTKLKIINDNKSKIFNVKDVADDILKDNVINKDLTKSLHDYISSVFTTFEEKVVLESLTEEPTPIMLKEVKEEVDDFLTSELETLASSIESFKRTELSVAIKLIDNYLEMDYSNYRLQIVKMAELARALLNKVSSSKETIVPVSTSEQTEFIDITTSNISELSTYDNIPLEDTDAFIEAIKSIEEIVNKDSYSKFLFHSLSGLKEFESLPSLTEQLKYKEDNITIVELLRFFNSETLLVAIHNVDKQLTEIGEYLKKDEESFLDQSSVLEECVSKSINVFYFLVFIQRLTAPSFIIFKQISKLLK